jgi:WD40 repeat protein
LTAPPPRWHSLYPQEFSPDGNLLLDSACNVWDLTTGQQRFQVPAIYNSSLFSQDSQELIVVATSNSDSWLAFYDVASGEERVERRVPLTSGGMPEMHLVPAAPDRSLLLASGFILIRPGPVEQWLARLTGVQDLANNQTPHEFVLVETQTGQGITRGGINVWSSTPDGRYVLTQSRDNVYQLWDVPARKPLRWFLPALALWSLAAGGFTWLVVHIVRRISEQETSQPALRS